MVLLDKEELKELLYWELALSQQIGQSIVYLKEAGEHLRRLGEALEKHPLLSQTEQAGERLHGEDNTTFCSLLMECSGGYAFAKILSELANLRQQRDQLEHIQKKLYPIRNSVNDW